MDKKGFTLAEVLLVLKQSAVTAGKSLIGTR